MQAPLIRRRARLLGVFVVCVSVSMTRHAHAQQEPDRGEDQRDVNIAPPAARRVLLAPSASYHMGRSNRLTPGLPRDKNFHIAVHGGLSISYVKDHRTLFYIAPGLEAGMAAFQEETRISGYLMPMTQLGAAMLGCRDELDREGMDAATVMASCLKIYALFGARPDTSRRPGSWRMGLGLNSSAILKASAQCGVPIPNSLEVFREVGRDGSVHQFVRIGIGF